MNVLFVQLPNIAVCVVPASQVTSLGIDTANTVYDDGTRVAVLDELLGTPSNDGPALCRTLVVVRDNQKTVFRTAARLELDEIDGDSFYQLPSVLRSGSCRPWVRGLVTMPAESEDPLGVWVDIDELAQTVWGELRAKCDADERPNHPHASK